MSIQYKDLSFSDTKPLEEIKKQFQEELESGVPVRALFVGTESELKAIKAEESLKVRVENLENEMSNIKEPTSDLLEIPTKLQIKRLIDN